MAKNTYCVGDYILVDPSHLKFAESKLSPKLKGPYEVVSTYEADITAKHIVTHEEVTVHMENVKPFFGNREEAHRIACVDRQQFVIDCILGYKGEPSKRSTMMFWVLFEDGDERWLPWSEDLSTAKPFEVFCEKHSELT